VPDQHTWIIDFDETLASGNLTWALQYAFPSFIARHQLPHDPQRLHDVMLTMQQAASGVSDPAPLMARLFEAMQWDPALQDQLLNDIFSNFRPSLFDDALPFLERLSARGDRVLVVSNNPRTLEQVHILPLEPYIAGVFTPQSCPGTLAKPDRSLWDFIIAHDAQINPDATTVVGDDPWSEGEFAQVCGLPCWIVDRLDRFGTLTDQPAYRRVRSLLDISL
jgi:FMN phosphatase YigB (HAD superfamily)